MVLSIVGLALTSASLLSGNNDSCQTRNDTSCSGGMAAVSAFVRNTSMPTLLIPRADEVSSFVQMHPLGWSVNRLILHDHFGWDTFVASSPLVTNDDISRDLTFLQTKEFSLLITNVAIPPSNSWFPFTETIHFDKETKLAVLSITPPNQIAITQAQLPSAMGALDYVARINEESNETWIPAVFFAKPSPSSFREFREGMVKHSNPPALLIDIRGSDSAFAVPTKQNNTWVASYRALSRTLHRFELHTDGGGVLRNVTLVSENLRELPSSLKDRTYASDITFLRELADEAIQNDPVVGTSGFVPLTRDDGFTRRCMGGERVVGNLFTDALRWYAGAEVAFVTSGGLRGPGWEAGPVHVSDLWAALPFANNICEGVMSGVSLFRLLNYSTSVATFQSTYTETGDQILQISGARYTYNTKLNVSRLVEVEIWDEGKGAYQPIERLKFYKFATDSFLCGVSPPFPDLLVNDLIIEGEVPGEIDGESLVHQYVVAEYLSQLNSTYNTTLQGRLRNYTTATEALNLIQTQDTCPPETTWEEKIQSCIACPEASKNVAFSDELLEFETRRGNATRQEGRIVLVNREVYPVVVKSKVIPDWVEFVSLNSSITLGSGESLGLDFTVGIETLSAETTSSTVSFGVLDGRSAAGCVGRDVSFEILMTVRPSEDLNQLDGMRFVGFGLCAVVLVCSIAFGALVVWKRDERVIKTMQPPFLIQICSGVFVMATTIIPFSIDDGVVSVAGCDTACMAVPWLMSMGFTITFAALFSKLWRINKLFNTKERYRRVAVREKDVILPFLVLFGLNCIVLLVWTLVDPLRWERTQLPGEPWNSFGSCEGDGAVSNVMLGLTTFVNAGALVLAFHQAYLARNISSEFSESKYLGIALFSWVQVFIVGGPVIFLLEEGSTSRYFLVVAIIFTTCVSMLSLIFIPMIILLKRPKKKRTGSIVISGLGSVSRASRASLRSSIRNSLGGSSDGDEEDWITQIACLRANISQLKRRNQELENQCTEFRRREITASQPSTRSGNEDYPLATVEQARLASEDEFMASRGSEQSWNC